MNGETPQQAAIRLQAARFPATQFYPEGSAGGQGAHLHIGMGPAINPPASTGADGWTPVGAHAGAPPDNGAADPDLYKVILQEAGPNATPRHVAALASEIVNRSRQSGQSYIDVINARDQYGPGFSSDTAEGKAWERVAAIPDSDPRLQRIAAAADPYLTGQRQPLPYTGHWSPSAADATGETRPAWADQSGTPIEGNVFYSHPYGPNTVPAADGWAPSGRSQGAPGPQTDPWAPAVA